MSSQEREWQPGDKALVEVEVVEFGDQPEALVHVPRGDGPGVQAIVRTSDLRPVPAGGEVEAAVRLVVETTALGVEQAREYLTAALELVRAGEVEAATEDVIERAAEIMAEVDYVPAAGHPGLLEGEREAYRNMARALAAAGLLAGGVPGRSEAEIEWGVMSDRHGYVVYTDFTSREQAQGHLMDDSYVVSRQVGPWTAARVAGTTEAGDDRG